MYRSAGGLSDSSYHKKGALVKSVLVGIVTVAILVPLSSCSDKSAGPATGSLTIHLYQIPGCGGSGRARGSSVDSCFTYTFRGDLEVTCCLPANCCPDSQRFSLSSTIVRDTIRVAVRDTAQNLCRCICSYDVRAKFTALPLDRYLFVMQYDDSVWYKEFVRQTQ